MPSRMYVNVKTWNPFVGCRFRCVYCVPSFQRQIKRQKKRCKLCYNYEPHFHPERLSKVPNADTIFACAFGDIRFARLEWLEQIVDVIKKHPYKEFYIQTKDPSIFRDMLKNNIEIPENVIIGITLETDKDHLISKVSKAPLPQYRYNIFKDIQHPRKYVTIEPILDFNLSDMISMIKTIRPEFVYIGYDNHNCKLPEPELHKTKQLIEKLRLYTEVRLKTIREAWWITQADLTLFEG